MTLGFVGLDREDEIRERRFGVDLLQFVADKHGRQKAGEEARMVLRAEGF